MRLISQIIENNRYSEVKTLLSRRKPLRTSSMTLQGWLVWALASNALSFHPLCAWAGCKGLTAQ